MSDKSRSPAINLVKMFFAFGLGIFFVSFFFEWYQFNAYLEDGTLVGNWTFYMFLGWRSIFIDGISPNDSFRPLDMPNVFLMCAISITFIFICAYGLAFKSIEKSSSRGAESLVYCNVILLVLNGYFLTFLPCQLLASNNLFFPFLTVTQVDSGNVLTYSIGPGYIMQALSFVAMFSYVVFSMQTMKRYETLQEPAKIVIEKRIEQSQEIIPIDRYIAEEELEITRSKKEDLASVVLYKFKKSRKKA